MGTRRREPIRLKHPVKISREAATAAELVPLLAACMNKLLSASRRYELCIQNFDHDPNVYKRTVISKKT